MATTFRDITTPDLSDPALFVQQFKAMAEDADDAIGTLLDQTRMVRSAAGGDIFLNGSYQGDYRTSFTPPPSWVTYRVLAVVTANLAGVGANDQVESLVQISSEGRLQSGLIATDNAGAQRGLVAFGEWSDVCGPSSFLFRVRNKTAARGAVYTSWTHITATQTS